MNHRNVWPTKMLAMCRTAAPGKLRCSTWTSGQGPVWAVNDGVVKVYRPTRRAHSPLARQPAFDLRILSTFEGLTSSVSCLAIVVCAFRLISETPLLTCPPKGHRFTPGTPREAGGKLGLRSQGRDFLQVRHQLEATLSVKTPRVSNQLLLFYDQMAFLQRHRRGPQRNTHQHDRTASVWFEHNFSSIEWGGN
jgi:hypothetical protein